MQLIDPPTGTFTTQEVARLLAYRAAVARGFFTDWDGSAGGMDTHLLEPLPPAEATLDGDAEAYPFTSGEREHLEELRAAVAAGRYAEDSPPGATPNPEFTDG